MVACNHLCIFVLHVCAPACWARMALMPCGGKQGERGVFHEGVRVHVCKQGLTRVFASNLIFDTTHPIVMAVQLGQFDFQV